MQYRPVITKNAIIFDLQKPIFGSRFAIWDKWFKHAGNRNIVVNTPFGKATFTDARAYKAKAERIKRYYKDPNEPMIFWALDFKPEIDARDERKKQEELQAQSMHPSILDNPLIKAARARLSL
jgi:hypothetical protein